MILKVQFLRRGFGITQERISKVLGISVPTLRKKEIGASEFTQSEITKLTEMMKEYDPKLTMEEIFFN